MRVIGKGGSCRRLQKIDDREATKAAKKSASGEGSS